jgi:glucosamine--fructose-6-phosphate aminotransferase (isomerizing)
MRGEIEQIPAVIGALLTAGDSRAKAAAERLRTADPPWISIVARGTSDHAAVYARYLIETHLGIPAGLAAASVVTLYGVRLEWSSGAVIAISQSGQSHDVVAVTQAARQAGALTLAITNDGASPLAEAADVVLTCDVGEERAVPATKTYVAELAVLAQLIAALRPESDLARSLPDLPEALAAAVVAGRAWVDSGVATAFDGADRCIVTSRGYNLATALELALKLKETIGLFAEAQSAADLLHGPLALASADIPILAFRPDGPAGRAGDEAITAIERRGGRPWIVGGPEVADRPHALSLDAPTTEALTPMAYVIPGYLLAEALARRRGINPDAPAGLRKITRTR